MQPSLIAFIALMLYVDLFSCTVDASYDDLDPLWLVKDFLLSTVESIGPQCISGICRQALQINYLGTPITLKFMTSS